MCSIVGYIDLTKSNVEAIDWLKSANAMLAHRGPDDSGIWYDDTGSVGFGHNRLSIIDLSTSARQPMVSENGTSVLIFNGEIYNFRQLQIKFGLCKLSHSDTQTLLELIHKIGFENAIKEVRGMFALAYYDLVNKDFYLARDRFGEKPLSYVISKEGLHKFYFASEVTPLSRLSSDRNTLCTSSLDAFLSWSYVPAQASVYEEIQQLKPGTILKIRLSDFKLKIQNYSDPISIIKENRSKTTNKQLIKEKLILAVERTLVSDVDVGIFLSGGIDSSLVASIASQELGYKLPAFSIGFSDTSVSEQHYANKIAKYLDIPFVGVDLPQFKAVDLLHKIVEVYDEPIADPSCLPTIYLSEYASKQVKVVLTGDGADELFFGYSRHFLTEQYYSKIFRIPHLIRSLFANSILKIPPKYFDRFLPMKDFVDVGYKAHKGARVLSAKNDQNLYKSLTQTWYEEDIRKKDVLKSVTNPQVALDMPNMPNPTDVVRASDILNYLPSNVILKVDRATMAFGLEARSPFLDWDLFCESTKLDLSENISKNGGKHILKDILSDYLPQNLFDRPKKGFGFPIKEWLRGDLRCFVESYLLHRNPIRDEFFNSEVLEDIWKSHLNESQDLSLPIWNMLILMLWLEKNNCNVN